MPYFVGLDASKKTTHICVMDRKGDVVRTGVVASEVNAIVGFLRGDGHRYAKVGMESWTMAALLYQGLAKAGLPVICIDVRRAHGVMKAQRNKTDKNDAQAIAELMRVGAYRAVHIKSVENLHIRALLTARSTLVSKIRDLGNSIHGVLLGYGYKLAKGQPAGFDRSVKGFIDANPKVAETIGPLLRARQALQVEKRLLDEKVRAEGNADPTCRRLMTAPGVGVLTAMIFKSAIDEPLRFAKSRSIGAHLGLTPKRRQSGETSYQGRITKWGDRPARAALYLAARSLCAPRARRSWLTEWAEEVRARRGYRRSIVAVARRLAVILHRMWVSETDFQWSTPASI